LATAICHQRQWRVALIPPRALAHGLRPDKGRLVNASEPNESKVDAAKQTVGQTPANEVAQGSRPLDLEKAFDALGVSALEEYGEWKPEDSPKDAFQAMHRGLVRMVGGPALGDKIAYAFGAEFVEVRINRFTTRFASHASWAPLPPAAS
jgi:CO/xanthine dehydrogenase Mo-binding subunit